MTATGESIELSGTLIRDGGGFAVRVERGVLFHLQLHRVPVDQVEKRVKIKGFLIEERLIEVESLSLA